MTRNKPSRRNVFAASLSSPKFRQRVVEDKRRKERFTDDELAELGCMGPLEAGWYERFMDGE